MILKGLGECSKGAGCWCVTGLTQLRGLKIVQMANAMYHERSSMWFEKGGLNALIAICGLTGLNCD